MALIQKFGIKYPFSSDNDDMVYVDLNNTYSDSIKSQVLHVLFTPKGQRLRNPDFGTDVIKYLFEQSDEITLTDLKDSLRSQIAKYVKNVEFDDILIVDDDKEGYHKIVEVSYTVVKGSKKEKTKTAIRI